MRHFAGHISVIPSKNTKIMELLLLFLSLLGVSYGALSALSTEETCKGSAHYVCQVEKILQYEFPRDDQDLQIACVDLNSLKECIADSAKNCKERLDKETSKEKSKQRYSFTELIYEVKEERRLLIKKLDQETRQDIKHNQALLDVLSEVCDEESQLHANFVLHMACYRQTFEVYIEEEPCLNYSSKAFKYLQNRINGKMEGENDEKRSTYDSCLKTLFEMECTLELINKNCSIKAKDTAIDIAAKGANLDDQCPRSIRIDILELLDALKIIVRKEIIVRQLLELESLF